MSEDDKKISAASLIKSYKVNIARKILAGEVGLSRELEYLQDLEQRSAPPAQSPSNPGDDIGIPAKLRVKRYTLSPEAREARRRNAQKSTGPNTSKGKKASSRNAWKHGKYAQGFVDGFIKPCTKTCSLYPCEVISEGGTQPGDICLDKAEILRTFRAIQTAVKENNYDDINDIVALKVAGAMRIVDMLMEDIVRDNTVLKKLRYDKDGKEIGFEIVPHPSLFVFPKMLSELGITLVDLRVTRKAVEEGDEEEKGLKTLASLMSNIGGKLKMLIDAVEPIRLRDLKKDILIPRLDFELWLERLDWTFHQLARDEFPAFMFSNYYAQRVSLQSSFESLDIFQLACICNDPALWVPAFLREPEDPDHQDPYSLWEYQQESIRYTGHTVHYCGSEVGKTRQIIAYCQWKAHTVSNGSGLIGAPQQTHLDEIIEGIYEQLDFNPDIFSVKIYTTNLLLF